MLDWLPPLLEQTIKQGEYKTIKWWFAILFHVDIMICISFAVLIDFWAAQIHRTSFMQNFK